MLKNKVEYDNKREGVSKEELQSIKHRQEAMAKKLEENKRVIDQTGNEASSYREVIQQLTKENQELKLKIEDGNSDQHRLRSDLTKIEENYQNHILKIHERMQNIESGQPEMRTNCDVLESDDYSNVRMSSSLKESNEKPFRNSRDTDQHRDAMPKDLGDSYEMSWDLSNTNVSIGEKGDKYEKLETIREENHKSNIEESNTKPRFEGNK